MVSMARGASARRVTVVTQLGPSLWPSLALPLTLPLALLLALPLTLLLWARLSAAWA